MSPRLPAITARELIRVGTKVGFLFDRQRGSHAVYYRDSDGARIVVPLHAGRTIKAKTLAAILDDMGLTVEEFRRLL